MASVISEITQRLPKCAYLPFQEPTQIKDQTVKVAATITVKYADEPYNAEASHRVAVARGRIWIATKREATQGAYYELPASVWGGHGTVTVRPRVRCLRSPQTRHTRRTGSIM